MRTVPSRPRTTLLAVLLLWFAFYGGITLFTPSLFDDADSVHAEVAREMLLRHDYVTLHANGIRYLEKAPLFYWSMAATMRLSQSLGATTPRALAAAARLPLAFTVLALALLCETFARRMFRSVWAGLYAALITLSSFGIFIFTRILIPDAMVCLWLTLAMFAFWQWKKERAIVATSDRAPTTSAVILTGTLPLSAVSLSERSESRDTYGPSTTEVISTFQSHTSRRWLHKHQWPFLFAVACALNVLTKGLIGAVFPIAITCLYLLLANNPRNAWQHIRALFPFSAILLFFALAAPWHVLAGLANPTQGHPAAFHFVHGHWLVPLPIDGNVRGWFWFYFMNEHLLRYLNLRVPHDYDTSPLWLFWGLCLAWLLPWSAFLFRAAFSPLRNYLRAQRIRLRSSTAANKHRSNLSSRLFLIVWAAFVLLFFSLSTRQEYYVLPALPALTILLGGWLANEASVSRQPVSSAGRRNQRTMRVGLLIWLVLGTIYTSGSMWVLLHLQAPSPNTDLASLLTQNPADYALSMGHFLDLNAHALGLFRPPLVISSLSLLLGPVGALLLCKYDQRNAANLVLAASTFTFLIASFLALRTFAPVLSSAQLADAIAPHVHADDLIVIHGEYEAGSTLGFYLQRDDIHILEGRSSNLWYGSFFRDAPPIFETPASLAQKWTSPQRIYMWQSTTDEPRTLPPLNGPVYVIASSGGKQIVSNRPAAGD